jgi:proteic killer suppression protein
MKNTVAAQTPVRQHSKKTFTNQIKLLIFDVSNVKDMIISFGSKETEQIWKGIWVKKMPIDIQNIGRRKLRMLNNSQDIADLRIPPSNRLEKLTGKLKEFYSIRINKQWQIIFLWDNGNASNVEIIDYH